MEEALERADAGSAADYRYSFDMLGEAAVTADDALRYTASYAHAIHAIGAHDRWRGVHKGNGISIKLSALHPRYAWSQRGRVMGELLPRVRHLCMLAKGHEIGLTIDAEESDRLELSLDLFEALATDPELLLFDEPTSALDPIATANIEELVTQLRDRVTILIVTHNMQQAARVSHFTAYMYLGEVVEYGVTDEVFLRPKKKETEDYITGRFG